MLCSSRQNGNVSNVALVAFSTQVETLIAKHKKLLDANAIGRMKVEFEEQMGQQVAADQRDTVRVSLVTIPAARAALANAEDTAARRAKVGAQLSLIFPHPLSRMHNPV